MNEPSALLERLSEEAVWRLEEACCRFEEAWQAGRRPHLEDFLAAGRPAAEVAAELGVAVAVVNSATYRVIRHLRSELAGAWG